LRRWQRQRNSTFRPEHLEINAHFAIFVDCSVRFERIVV
jgi:hypothetical protein